jgi:hypothetical protein
LPLVAINCKSNIASTIQVTGACNKLFFSDDQASSAKANTFDRKIESAVDEGNRRAKTRARTSSIEFKKMISNPVNSQINSGLISLGRSNNKKPNAANIENSKFMDKHLKVNVDKFHSVRRDNCSVNIPSDNRLIKSKDYCAKNIVKELDLKLKNFQSEYGKGNCFDRQDCKSRPIGNLAPRLSNDLASVFHRENNQKITMQYPLGESNVRNNSSNNSLHKAVRKNLDQQSFLPKMAPMNFPPLRAPQSIVNVRHPFVTKSRMKHNDISVSNGLKSKSTMNTLIHSNMKELETGRQTYHNFGTSTLNITANISPYPRPDSFSQPSLASLLFPDNGQFSQSASSYSTNQLNQFQAYDHTSYHTNTPVMPHFSDNSLSFPQYDSTTFVQPNHYSAADITNNQFQYQTASVGQIQEPSLFIQSLQSPIAMTDQFATTNYARALRTELIHRLPGPPRYNK